MKRVGACEHRLFSFIGAIWKPDGLPEKWECESRSSALLRSIRAIN